ncbi:hypothetical protein [Streptomyces sp. NPDC053560]|uniref:hypothetical protein n=1 Tax=Streptomyces sp. NPDC053560 TaxID=3365711 RepID=UPI0037D59D8D
MRLTKSGGVFALIEESFVGARQDVQPYLVVRDGDRSVRLSPEACREALYGPQRDDALGAAVWRQAITDAQQEPKDGNGTKRLLVVWMALPGLYRNLHRILRHLRVERADLEAEAVLAVLLALDSAGPDSPGAGGHMIKEAVNQMWAYANRLSREIPGLDIAALAKVRSATAPPAEQPPPTDGWELHLTPPPHRDGLAATLRFAESRMRQEGERLGALAHCAGLSDLVRRARRHEEASLVGTLVLRPVGARR